MYCPSCGSEVTSALSYCNRCGANLKPLSNQPVTPPKLVGATWALSLAIVVVTISGFGMVFSLVKGLVDRGVNLSGGGMALVVFFLLILLAIDALLVRQLSRVLDISRLLGAPQAQQPQPALTEKSTPQIDAPREPASSVTEHTTRMFEPIPRDRDTQR